ncbi:MAG TPA: hypothetical protein VFD58_29225 [Blastocatellia bacterium]|nr:hypothetical protein [Blastocatellia bacterium]
MRNVIPATLPWCLLILLSLSALAQSTSPQTQPQTQPQSQEENQSQPGNLTLPEGTTAKLSLQTQLSSKLSERGDEVVAVLYEAVRDKDGRVAIPRGTEFFGRVTQVQAAKRPQKEATLTVIFDRMRMPYGEEKVSTSITAIDDYGNDEKLKSKDGEGKVGGGRSGGRTARNAGTGAGIGSVGGIIIAAAGGGIGGLASAVGVGAVGGVLMTKGNDIKLQPGTVLRIRFEKPVTVPAFDGDRTATSPRNSN